MAAAQTCKEAGYVPFVVGGNLTRWMPAFWFDYLLLNTAGAEFRENLMWGKEQWTSDKVLHVFTLWKELIDKGYFNDNFAKADSREAIQMVGEGKGVMMLQGPWAINELAAQGLVLEEEFGMFPFPQLDPDIPPAAEGAIVSWCINPATREYDAASRFMAYMAGYEAMEFLAAERNTLSPRKDIGFGIYDESTRGLMKELSDVVDESTLYMNFELATLPPIQDAGMDAFIRFMARPDRYEQICQEMEEISRRTFGDLK